MPDVPDVPDDELVARYLAGDAGAFADLVRRHERRTYALCLRTLGNPDDAADAAQDVLLVLARKADRYRGESLFTTWLYRVTMNVCYDHLRRAKRRPLLQRAPDPGEPAHEPGPPVPDHADAVADAQDVSVALARVPEDFRIALVLADVQDLPYEEIAKVLDLPIGTVKSRVHRGRIALAREMGAGASEPGTPSRTSQERP